MSDRAAPSKYRNQPTERDGYRFASRKEARRYDELRLLEKAGEISDLKLQVRYPLVVNGVKIGVYVADFVYQSHNPPCQVVEDCKGVRTPVYKLKALLMFALYGVTIFET